MFHFQSKSRAVCPTLLLVPHLSRLRTAGMLISSAVNIAEKSSSYPFCPTRTDWSIKL